jgi:protein AATF/BFR2
MHNQDSDSPKRKSIDSFRSRGKSGGAATRGSSRHNSNNDLFTAVHDLDAEDSRADRKRRKHHHRASQQSRAARSQMEVYWSLVECRILLQRSIIARGALPQQQRQQPSQQPSGHDDSLTAPSHRQPDRATSAAIVLQCNDLLAKLLEARRLLRFDGERGEQRSHGGCTSIDYAPAVKSNRTELSPVLAAVLQAEYSTVREGWKEVLNRRQRDVMLHSGLTSKTHYRVLDSTFWQQVEATAAHEQHQRELRWRQSSSSLTSTAVVEFDDSKLYQQLLKDFVSSYQPASSASTAAAAQDHLRRSRQALSASSTGTKKDVDRKASKGRKIRYHDIPKLQHFTFPVSRGGALGHRGGGSSVALLDEDEWFRSLFGGTSGSANRG